MALFRIELDDKMLFDGNHDLLTGGQSKNLAGKSFIVAVKPLRNGA